MEFRITMKLALIVEELVNPVQHALMGFRIKMKLALTAEDHVLPVQLVPMEFAIKMKLVLTAEEPVLLVVRKNITSVEIDLFDLFNIKKCIFQKYARFHMIFHSFDVSFFM